MFNHQVNGQISSTALSPSYCCLSGCRVISFQEFAATNLTCLAFGIRQQDWLTILITFQLDLHKSDGDIIALANYFTAEPIVQAHGPMKHPNSEFEIRTRVVKEMNGVSMTWSVLVVPRENRVCTVYTTQHNLTFSSLSPSLRCCTHLYFLVIDYSFDEDSLDSFLEFSSSSNGGDRPLNWVQFSFGTTFWGVFIRCYSKVRVHF